MFGWNDRPTKVECRHRIGGDVPARVVQIGQYAVTIPDNVEADITYTVPYHQSTEPRQAFPNMEVRDGEMRIPLDDIVGAILARVEPSEIAVALWSDEAVRDQFVYALTTRYSEMNVGDADRRKVLDQVKEAIHSKALDLLGGKMASLEYSVSKRCYLHSEISLINDTLAHYGATRPPRGDEEGPQPLRIKDEGALPEFKIGGVAWNEAREFWRGEVLRQFPMPRDTDGSLEGGNAAGGAVLSTTAGAEGIAQGEGA
jgi:hypothetical protein